MEKFQLPVDAQFQSASLAAGGIHLLDRVPDARLADLSPLAGLQAVEVLLGAVYRRQAGERMGKRPQMLRAIHRLLKVPILSLRYAHGLHHLEAGPSPGWRRFMKGGGMTGFVWLASYPKSGNTWLRLALHSLTDGWNEPDFLSQESFAPIAASRRTWKTCWMHRPTN